MNPPNRVVRVGLCIVGVQLWVQPAARAQSYTVTDLGVLQGGPGSAGYAVNDAGQVAGASGLPPNGFVVHAFLWDQGVMTDLGTLGGPSSFAYGINNAAQVVGRSQAGGGFSEAFLWENGQMMDLGAPFQSFSEANAINDAGQIVGTLDLMAFLWEDGVMADLGTLPGFEGSGAFAINALGQVAGGAVSCFFCPTFALFWADGDITNLGTLPGYDSSGAVGINDSPQCVGASATISPSGLRASLWENGEVIDLGVGPGTRSKALGINNAGVIVGYWGTSDQFVLHYATKWVDGELIDLNDVIPADSGWVLHEANDINESGQIVGAGFNQDGQGRGFLLTPCAPADFECDGNVGPIDLAQLLASWGECPDPDDCPADLNADGPAGPADLAQLLASWGEFP